MAQQLFKIGIHSVKK